MHGKKRLEQSLLAGAVRVGLVQDFADTLLAGVLADFAAFNPKLNLDVQVGGSSALRRSLADGRLDLALCVAQPREEPLVAAPMCWLGDPALAERDPLPLALLDSPCVFRDAALMALEAAGRRWRLAVSTPTVSALQAAVAAGLGLTVRTAGFGHLERPAVKALPPVGRVGYVLITAADAGTGARRLGQLLAQAVAVPESF